MNILTSNFYKDVQWISNSLLKRTSNILSNMSSFSTSKIINTSSQEVSRINETSSESSSSSVFPLPTKYKYKVKSISKQRGTLGIRRCRIRGIKREDGDWVTAGTLLVRQLGILYFPGLNVGMGKNRDLFAMEHGRVMITTEKVNPNWDQKILQFFYGQYADKKDVPIYKTYFHVITDPMPKKFKLVDQI